MRIESTKRFLPKFGEIFRPQNRSNALLRYFLQSWGPKLHESAVEEWRLWFRLNVNDSIRAMAEIRDRTINKSISCAI